MSDKTSRPAAAGAPDDATVLAIDIGGSKYIVGFVDGRGTSLACERHEWRARTPQAIIDQLVTAAKALSAAHPKLARRAVAGGVTIPGLAEPVRGVWVDSDFLDVHELPICELLRGRLDLPFFGDNDCNACVLAESRFGSARGNQNFLYMTVSSGVGGGVFLGGDVLYGARFQSGEIGLTISEQGGRPSLSGNQAGPLEMYACTSGMAQTYAELGGQAPAGCVAVGGKEIAAAARAGDPAALGTLEREGRYLGRAIANAAVLFAPERVVVGGGISLMYELYQEPLLAELARLGSAGAPEVRASTLGYEGALLGAAACALRGTRGFVRASGAGVEACVLELSLAKGALGTQLIVDGRAQTRSHAPGLAAYLVADTLADGGQTLGSLVREVYEADACPSAGAAGLARLARLGDALGRGLAFACMLFDPGVIRLRGDFAGLRAALEPALMAAVQRETYWEPGKLPYRFEWV